MGENPSNPVFVELRPGLTVRLDDIQAIHNKPFIHEIDVYLFRRERPLTLATGTVSGGYEDMWRAIETAVGS